MFYTRDDVNAYIRGRGKGERFGPSGEGHGRRRNPKDKDGMTMKCHGCNAEDHLVGNCPRKGKGKGGPPLMYARGNAFHTQRTIPDPMSHRAARESAIMEEGGEDAGPLDALISSTTNMTSSTMFAGAAFNEETP